jgi:hypothetical protein
MEYSTDIERKKEQGGIKNVRFKERKNRNG